LDCKIEVSKIFQEFSLDGLREGFYLLFETLGLRSYIMTIIVQADLRNVSFHGDRQVGVRTRTDVFSAGFCGPAKQGSRFLECRCTMYLRFTFTVKKSKGGR
jgi:hypothetical protein